MCGRFVSSSTADDLAEYFSAVIEEGKQLEPSHNVAPSNEIYGVVERPTDAGANDPRQAKSDGDDHPAVGPTTRELATFHWGLVPFWAKDRKIGYKMINARAETVAEKPAYRKSIKSRRCIIPADGFYEWKALDPAVDLDALPGMEQADGAKPKKAKRPPKQPVFIHRVDDEPIAFAGLWDRWRGADRELDDDEALVSATIITTEANDVMSRVHNRMPVILPASRWSEWLDPSNDDVESLTKLLVPAPEELLTFHPVSTDVNKPTKKTADLTDAIDVPEHVARQLDPV